MQKCGTVPFICKAKAEINAHRDAEVALLQVFFFYLDAFGFTSTRPATSGWLWPIPNTQWITDVFTRSCWPFGFSKPRLIFSITASATGVKKHIVYTMRGKQIPVPPFANRKQTLWRRRPFPGEPPAPGLRSIRRECGGELFQPSAIIWGMFSTHTSWTYMYQGFDIFAILSVRPATGGYYDVTQALKINRIVYLWLHFLLTFHVVFVCVYPSVRLDVFGLLLYILHF